MKRRVVYYHGCVVDYFDHKTGRAVIQLLDRTGCAVEVPDLICCSYPLLSSGEIVAARKRAAQLTGVLGRFVDRGYQIVYSCPTCGHALKEAYPKLLHTQLAASVAANTHFISRYLLELHRNGEIELQFKDRPLQVAYHTPCHLRSQNLSTASVEVLSLIPELNVRYVDRGCCGMGGTWALRSRRRGELGAEVGGPLFREILERQPQIIATDCFGCGIQIARHTQNAPIHPLQILSEALT